MSATFPAFISYPRERDQEAKRVRDLLVEGAFLDVDDPELIGRANPEEIAAILQDRLRRSEALVVLWDRSHAGSPWCQTELRVFSSLGRPVIVVALRDFVLPPSFLLDAYLVSYAALRGKVSQRRDERLNMPVVPLATRPRWTVADLIAIGVRARRRQVADQEIGTWLSLKQALLEPGIWATRHAFQDHSRTIWASSKSDEPANRRWRREGLAVLGSAVAFAALASLLMVASIYLVQGELAARHATMVATLNLSLVVTIAFCDRISSAVGLALLCIVPAALGVLITGIWGIQTGGLAGGVTAGAALVLLAHFRESASPRVGFELAPFPEVNGLAVAIGTVAGVAFGYAATRAGFVASDLAARHLTTDAALCAWLNGPDVCLQQRGWASFSPTTRGLVGAAFGLVASVSGVISNHSRWQAWSRAREAAPFVGTAVTAAAFTAAGGALAYFLPERAGSLGEGASVGALTGLLLTALYLLPTAIFGGRLSDRRVTWLGLATAYAVMGALIPLITSLPNLRSQLSLIVYSAVTAALVAIPVLRYLHSPDRRFALCLLIAVSLEAVLLGTTPGSAAVPTMIGKGDRGAAGHGAPDGLEGQSAIEPDVERDPAPNEQMPTEKQEPPPAARQREQVTRAVAEVMQLPLAERVAAFTGSPPAVQDALRREHPAEAMQIGHAFCQRFPNDAGCRSRRVSKARGKWNSGRGLPGEGCFLVNEGDGFATGPGCSVTCEATTHAGRKDALTLTLGGASFSGTGEGTPLPKQTVVTAGDTDGVATGAMTSNVTCRRTRTGYECEDGGGEDWNDLVVTCKPNDVVPNPNRK